MPSLPCYMRVIWTKTNAPLAFRAVSVGKFYVKQVGPGRGERGGRNTHKNEAGYTNLSCNLLVSVMSERQMRDL